MPDSLPITFYKNGFFMSKGPLRPYSDPTARLFIKDLSDGYFPWELKERFKEGTPIAATDRRYALKNYTSLNHVDRDQVYSKAAQAEFAGRGHVLGGEAKPSRLVHGDTINDLPPALAPADFNSAGDSQAFLRRLPKNIVSNGKVSLRIKSSLVDVP